MDRCSVSTQDLREDIAERIEAYLGGANETPLRTYVVANSHLPGPRGNLELAAAFADIAGRVPDAQRPRLWALCEDWSAIPPSEALPNDPKEFLVFCGIRGIGGIAGASRDEADRALAGLHELARDPRWRTREAVAMALQDLLKTQQERVLHALEDWIRPGGWFEMRAVAAAVAEPPLLQDPKIARAAVAFHRKILAHVAAAEDRTSESFKVLRQGLGYSVSVVVAAMPREGFPWLRRLAASKDADVAWIVRENLRKKRLTAKFPREVAHVRSGDG